VSASTTEIDMSNESKALELALTQFAPWFGGEAERIMLNSAAELRRQQAEIESLLAQLADAATDLRAEQERRRAEIRAQLAARVPDGCVVADVGFRWDGERQHHVPKLVVEFEPVPENSPWDAKGWKDRDAVAAMLSAAPSQQAPVQGEPFGWWHQGNDLAESDFYPASDFPDHAGCNTCIPLYTHPQQAREPMTREEEEQGWLDECDIGGINGKIAFLKGIRFAERFHKIGEKQC
jgi:hypothetical protein